MIVGTFLFLGGMAMRKAWLKVVVGALFEVAWVIGMKYSTSWWESLGRS